jgi:hypothetical protein
MVIALTAAERQFRDSDSQRRNIAFFRRIM